MDNKVYMNQNSRTRSKNSIYVFENEVSDCIVSVKILPSATADTDGRWFKSNEESSESTPRYMGRPVPVRVDIKEI